MRRVTGKLTAAILTAAMTMSSVAGGYMVFADELTDAGQEIVITDDYIDMSANDNEENVSGIEEDNDGAAEIDEILTDDMDLPGEESFVEVEDPEDAAEGSDQVEDEEYAASSEDGMLENANGEIVIPVTEGRVLRLASVGTGIQKQQHIFFGKMDQGNYNYWDLDGENKPYWRVLDPAKDNAGGSGAMLVMSETLWGKNPDDLNNGSIAFNENKDNKNVWQGSDANTWCSSFLANSFSEPERVAIRGISKRDDAVTGEWKTCYLKGDKVFFLSVAELEKYLGTNKYDYGADYMNYGKHGWWLRTPSWDFDDAASQATYGFVGNCIVSSHLCARPVFNINNSSILFTSAAVGGKASGSLGSTALKAVNDKGTKDWKLTIKDTSRAFSAARVGSGNVKPGGTVKIQYSGAKSGSNEYVSAALCDSAGTVLYYGRLVNNRVSGTTNVTLPQGLDAGNTYKLYVFSEQYNGNYKTDLASGLSKIDLKIPLTIKDTTLSKTKLKYTGKSRIPTVTTLSGKKLKEGTDYKKVIKNEKGKSVKSPVKVGKYKMTLTGIGNFYGSTTKTYEIVRANNTLSVKKKTDTHTFKLSQLKNGDKTVTANKLYNFVDKGQGKLSYSLYSAKKSGKSYKNKFRINSRTGKLTVKKGLERGTYTVSVKVKAKGNTNYKPKTKKVNFKVKVKKK